MGFMDMLKPKYKHSDPQVRLEAIKEIKDEKILYDIVINDENIVVRIEALERIRNHLSIAFAAWIHIDNSAQKEIIKRITNQRLLKCIAWNTMDTAFDVRMEAVEKITDQQQLIEISKSKSHNDENEEPILIRAVEKITDQQELTNIAKSTAIIKVRLKAVERITDQELLTEIAKIPVIETIKERIYSTGIRYVPTVLYNNLMIRDKAISQIKDKTIKTRILKEIEFDNMRIKDIEKNNEKTREIIKNKEIKRKKRIENNKSKGIKCPNCNSYDIEWYSSLYIGHLDMNTSGYKCHNCNENFAEFLVKK